MLTVNGTAWVGLINNKGIIMKYAKTLKENLQLVKEDKKVVVIHTKNGKVDFIEKGEYMVGKGGGTIFVRDAGVDFKDFVGDDPKAAKDSLVKFSHFDPKSIIIEGCGKIEEADVPTSKRELYSKAKIGFNGLKKRLDDILSLVEKGEYKFVSSFLDDVATSCQRMAKAYDDADRMDKAGKMTD